MVVHWVTQTLGCAYRVVGRAAHGRPESVDQRLEILCIDVFEERGFPAAARIFHIALQNIGTDARWSFVFQIHGSNISAHLPIPQPLDLGLMRTWRPVSANSVGELAVRGRPGTSKDSHLTNPGPSVPRIILLLA
ncbi:hypothetical protein RRG08_030709 [Elysia crispata]|uniref:Uncharacterized protein n=1 Tax=Elysia crispata TaxID=231223 RepID=A0AAE0Y490_9GAST|nr:hypothetical protein RRG08_030709 [Elysia crispata]